jgi:succinylglutamic semialdehyde dehydrogenase
VENPKVAEGGPFLPRGDYIGGRFEPPATPTGEIPLEDPGDTTALHGAFPFSAAALDAAVGAARGAYRDWRDTPARDRDALLQGLADRLREGRERLARVIAQEAGKPLWEARTEVDAMVSKVAITLEEGLGLVGDRSFELSPTMVGRWRAHPRGVLAVLGPFNFPGHLLHGWVVPALACGNTVVAKPSERTPAVGQLYAELVAEAGLPPGVFNLIQGDGDQGARLAAHPEVDGVLFTGSWAVGRQILEATLDQPSKLVALEMGGKNACLVCEDADLDAAVYHAAFGAAVTAGQRCSSTSRIIVHRSVSSSFTERLRLVLSGLTLGYPLEDGVFLGPVISAQARERHADVQRWAHEEGAEALLEGGPCEGPRPGHYVQPSLHRIPRVRKESRYQQEEHFVPDAALLECDSLEEAIEALNSTEYGLVASVFTRDRSRFEQVYREGRVGLLNWNTGTVGASSRLPFGGIGTSGNDRPAAVLSTLSCTYPVASLEVPSPPAPSPPPGFPWPL